MKDEKIKELLNKANIKIIDDNNDTLGKDLQEIAKHLTIDDNVFKFGNSNKLVVFEDACLGSIEDKPYYNRDVKQRYEFIKHFRYHYAVNRSALKMAQAERFKDLAGSLIGFKAGLEYRGAVNPEGQDERKESLIEKIKNQK